MKILLTYLVVWACVSIVGLTPAVAALDAPAIAQLGTNDTDQKVSAIRTLVATAKAADDMVLLDRLMNALSQDAAYKTGSHIVFVENDKAFDAITGAALGVLPADAEGVVANSRLRAEIDNTIAITHLRHKDKAVRLEAAKALQTELDISAMAPLKQALDAEQDAQVKALIALAYAQASLQSPDAAARIAAIELLADNAGPNVKTTLLGFLEKSGDNFREPDPAVRDAAQTALRAIERRLMYAEWGGRIFSGLSLGSILLLATLGLAITYGVMGVINMAHGEFLMIGAYTTYAVQSAFRLYAPQWLDAYVLAAIPVAFVVTAVIGMTIERLIIRHLYGRPLETLLATWGISLALIQAARVVFGPQNVEVANPSWLSGGLSMAVGVVLPWNRVAIMGFSVAVLVLMWALMNLTRLGMFVRAVTQNRTMAGCVGVHTARVDTVAFGLGTGIAGLGGVALSQISNVGPDMGQGYIVDTFMVVVLGGVGQLAGAVWAAMGLGILSKFLEGATGAVVAKIVVLLLIIVFIQKRPQGIFALKGRFADQ